MIWELARNLDLHIQNLFPIVPLSESALLTFENPALASQRFSSKHKGHVAILKFCINFECEHLKYSTTHIVKNAEKIELMKRIVDAQS